MGFTLNIFLQTKFQTFKSVIPKAVTYKAET